MAMEQHIIDRLDRVDDKLDKILVQTTATNGKVISLQDWRKEITEVIEDLKENKSTNKGRDLVLHNILKVVSAIALAIFVYWLGTKK